MVDPSSECDPVGDADQLSGSHPVEVGVAGPAAGGLFVDAEGGGVAGVFPWAEWLAEGQPGFASGDLVVVRVGEDARVFASGLVEGAVGGVWRVARVCGAYRGQ